MNVDNVSVRRLRPHPNNPRVGNVEAIAESLRVHGQYRPIVANRRTGHIVAGNHTYKAIRSLGRTKVDVVWVDVDDDTERRILLADNRTSDLAITNEAMVADLLTGLPDLTGTGYSSEFIEQLNQPDTDPRGGGSGTDTGTDTGDDDEYELRVGPFSAVIEPVAYMAWSQEFADLKNREVVSILRLRLEMPEVEEVTSDVPRGTEYTEVSASDAGNVPMDSLRPHPTNPREGDVGAVMGSLEQFGQYRPIVVDQHGTILAGHHVYWAAAHLGWQSIWAVRVQVTEEQALKILLVDNRTADLGGYDDAALASVLTSVRDVRGTGYDADDIAAIVSGSAPTPRKVDGKQGCKVGDYRWREPKAAIESWQYGISLDTVASRLQLPKGSLS